MLTVIELLRGLWITFKHLFVKSVTIQYPTEKREPAERFRGIHRFILDEAEIEQCVACSLCARYCPSSAIEITPAEDEKHNRRVLTYYVDIGRCIFCGFCIEACPKEAIMMSKDFELACYSRTSTIFSKEALLTGPDIVKYK
jgi:NADH-quinone oxidoreductase subunit I